MGEPGATIDAGGSGTGMGLSDARYVVVEGLTIQNTGVHGFNIDDASTFDTPGEYLIFRDLHFLNIGSGGNNDCLKMSGIDHFWILDSEFQDCNMGEAVDMVGCHEGVIQGNYFHDVAQNAVQTKGGSSDVLVYGNRFENIPGRAVNSGGSTGAAFFRPQDAPYEGARIQVVSNTFAWTTINMGVAVAYVGCDTCVFANNTIVEPNTYAARMLHENTNLPPSRDGYFINNIVVFNSSEMSGFTFFNAGPGHDTTGGTFVISNNLWFSLDDGGFSGPPVAAPIADDTDSVIQQDPALQGDYSILGSSPAVGQGRAVPRGIPGDFSGDAYASPPAIGAFAAP